MIVTNVRTTLRINDNLKTRLQLLAIKNNISFNKMLNYIIELGYGTYMNKFENDNVEINKNLKRKVNKNEKN